MLSRTADNLFWLARYVERAEYLARILEVTQRLTTLPLAFSRRRFIPYRRGCARQSFLTGHHFPSFLIQVTLRWSRRGIVAFARVAG